MDAYLGQIILFAGNYAPNGWLACNGQLLNINQYEALYSLLGTIYGGDGVTTFALPDLRSRIPVGQGQGTNLTSRTIAQTGGTESETLNSTQLPAHNHPFYASTNPATAFNPANTVLATAPTNTAYYFNEPAGSTLGPVAFGPNALQSAGGNQPHENRMPITAINFLMCVEGIYPNRPS